jgi:hypothetical protein
MKTASLYITRGSWVHTERQYNGGVEDGEKRCIVRACAALRGKSCQLPLRFYPTKKAHSC